MNTFKQLGLSNELVKVTSELGFEQPTEIQSEAIPLLLKENRDFIGLAQTGTGKTAAFGLPLLEKIDPSNKATQALILAPTRELGQQIAGQMEAFSKYLPKVNALAVYGGANIATQIKALRKPQQIIIATPGRLLDLLRRKAIHLDQLRFLILDEADEMLNMGFKEDIDKILKHTPKQKTTWLFSATMPNEMKGIVKRYMHHPIEVKVNSEELVNSDIEHQFVLVKQQDKTEALVRFLNAEPGMRGLIFCRTRKGTQKLADKLLQRNYKSDALHGDMSQNQRDKVMNKFKNHQLQVLVATDVAARGIDVNDLTHVFHFSLPDDLPYYTHRSGRTGRAGKKGISISFISGRDRNKLQKIGKQLDIEFQKVAIPVVSEIVDQQIENWCLEVLNAHPKDKIKETLEEKANMLFWNLSKEELILKLLSHKMGQFNYGTEEDLNQADKGNKGHKSHKGKKHFAGKGKRKSHNKKKSRKKQRRKKGIPTFE